MSGLRLLLLEPGPRVSHLCSDQITLLCTGPDNPLSLVSNFGVFNMLAHAVRGHSILYLAYLQKDNDLVDMISKDQWKVESASSKYIRIASRDVATAVSI